MYDLQAWDELLHQYVNEAGLVDYQAIATQSQKLTNWLEGLSQINPELLNREEQLAVWLNLYNALVIEQVLKKYPIDSILPKFLGVPNWFAFWRFFSRSIYSINRHRYSLNNIEHDIIRKQFQEPRIHFALVCAAKGCPLLRNEAYRSDRLETQLQEDAERFINNPQKVFYSDRTLYCSQIFKWYRQDFLKVANSIPEYIQTYLAVDLPVKDAIEVKYLDYDWHLNHLTFNI